MRDAASAAAMSDPTLNPWFRLSNGLETEPSIGAQSGPPFG